MEFVGMDGVSFVHLPLQRFNALTLQRMVCDLSTLNQQLRKGAWLPRSFTLSTFPALNPQLLIWFRDPVFPLLSINSTHGNFSSG
jgi:hypothetical protein